MAADKRKKVHQNDYFSITPYHAKYFAFELTRRSPSNSIQKLATTLVDAQVDLNPHQVEAALFAFRSPFSKGAILADEVGLGKTIEAGLVISQKWAERKRKILIIVPSNLRKQWSQELQEKFFLPSVIMEKKSFDETIKKGIFNPFELETIIITSYHFARSRDIFIERTNWDLVIIDEAHRLRNVYKPTNKIANALKDALLGKPKILLTATPLQNSLLELYGLVSIIDDYTFGDISSFKSQFSRLTQEENYSELKARLQPISIRTLRRQVLEYISFTNRVAIIQEFYPTENEQRLYDLVSEYLQSPTLYALPPGQRQLMTLILRKLLASSTFAISGTLEALSAKLKDVLIDQQNKSNVEETITQDYELFGELQDEWIDTEEDETDPQENEKRIYTDEERQEIHDEMIRLAEFGRLAKSIIQNSKGIALSKALKTGFDASSMKGAAKKAIIFTESVRTQKYLFNLLENSEYKGKLVLFNGTNSDPFSNKIYQSWLALHKGTDKVTGSKTADKRAAIVEYFRDHATILIATEAAAEGINLQFCSLIINYDLPWNPQRIEQRIGRCHRYGQKHDVVVVNFLNKANAADQRVYKLLAEKFKLFDGVFGASDEILGSIESGVDFEKRIVQIYQNCRTVDEIKQAFDELQDQLEPEIDEKLRFTRQQLLENFDEEVHEKLRLNFKTSQEYLNRYEFLLWMLTRYFLKENATYSDYEYSFYLKHNPIPDKHIHPGPYRIGKNIEDANVYRTGHPLASYIISACKNSQLPVAEIQFDYSNSSKKISILEPYIGKAGWLCVTLFTIEALESEDHLILCGFTDEESSIDSAVCHRLFSLNGTVVNHHDEIELPLAIKDVHKQAVFLSQDQILQHTSERNAGFFDEELTKLEKWAEDKKSSLEIELRQFDVEIKTRKAEARKLLKLDEKVKMQREIKEMEKRRNELRMNLYKHQDDVDQKKENLISDIEARLKQRTLIQELFTIHWTLS
ncbi:MAG: DEAD/DEAH box helicase family protein [Bacteroidales bacterium]|nr:DEAD/DEAH box helicase family protein [Bacteroidales bacterium]